MEATWNILSGTNMARWCKVRIYPVPQNGLVLIRTERRFAVRSEGVGLYFTEVVVDAVRHAVSQAIERLASNLDDLRKMVLGLIGRKVHVRSEKGKPAFYGAELWLLLRVMGEVAQLVSWK